MSIKKSWGLFIILFFSNLAFSQSRVLQQFDALFDCTRIESFGQGSVLEDIVPLVDRSNMASVKLLCRQKDIDDFQTFPMWFYLTVKAINQDQGVFNNLFQYGDPAKGKIKYAMQCDFFAYAETMTKPSAYKIFQKFLGRSGTDGQGRRHSLGYKDNITFVVLEGKETETNLDIQCRLASEEESLPEYLTLGRGYQVAADAYVAIEPFEQIPDYQTVDEYHTAYTREVSQLPHENENYPLPIPARDLPIVRDTTGDQHDWSPDQSLTCDFHTRSGTVLPFFDCADFSLGHRYRLTPSTLEFPWSKDISQSGYRYETECYGTGYELKVTTKQLLLLFKALFAQSTLSVSDVKTVAELVHKSQRSSWEGYYVYLGSQSLVRGSDGTVPKYGLVYGPITVSNKVETGQALVGFATKLTRNSQITPQDAATELLGIFGNIGLVLPGHGCVVSPESRLNDFTEQDLITRGRGYIVSAFQKLASVPSTLGLGKMMRVQ